MNEEQLEKQLQKLFRAFSERLVETETAIKSDIAELRDEIQASNDKLAKRLDIDDSERAAAEGVSNHHFLNDHFNAFMIPSYLLDVKK